MRDREIGNEAEMVAGPYSVNRLVKDPLAGGDFERGTSMLPAAHEDVIDPSKRPIPIRRSHQRILRRQILPALAWELVVVAETAR